VIRLAYIFWAAALFLLGGCGQQTVRMYRPDVLRQETATVSPAGLVFSPPQLASYEGYGQDVVAGVNLNYRPTPYATNGWVDLGTGQYYRLRYYDRHPNRSTSDGYLDRTFLYYQEGLKVR
jgi:hypothetical protein